MIDFQCVVRLVHRTRVRVDTVKVSPKYQVVIPKGVREAMGIKPGHEVAVLRYGGRIELIPMTSVREMRGFLRGVDSSVERESDRDI